MIASVFHGLQGCVSSIPLNKDCLLAQSNVQTPRASSPTLPSIDAFWLLLIGTLIIQTIIWFIALALGLFKSPFHIAVFAS